MFREVSPAPAHTAVPPTVLTGGESPPTGGAPAGTPGASRRTRGVGNPAAAPPAVSTLDESARARLRAVTGIHLVALARTTAEFESGVLVEHAEAAA
ncbi:hypothetical protein GCM10010249_19870 [Streptomyces roseolilacinus]|uniref:Uncharacterized protein n=1 Tax=Streptomyces roseolilacinus TaxID=66904 RepID=A0A918EJ03_9ACTN|nr:hypothetical protein GCM10010249_19870 [Streptomyces roseolilacinus]